MVHPLSEIEHGRQILGPDAVRLAGDERRRGANVVALGVGSAGDGQRGRGTALR